VSLLKPDKICLSGERVESNQNIIVSNLRAVLSRPFYLQLVLFPLNLTILIISQKREVDIMEREGNFARGCLWGLVISIPLWIALIWLVKSVIE
jgi:hypothetical protein